MERRTSLVALALVTGVAVAACTAGNASTFGNGNGNGSGNGSGNGNGSGGAGGDQTTLSGFLPSGQGGGDSTCFSGPQDDFDNDGYTGAQGDCNDCDPNVNPGALEVITDPNDPDAPEADENCNGVVDEPTPPCDDALPIGDVDPLNAARALNICTDASVDGFGVVSAAYVRANGTPVTPTFQVGLLDQFGPNVLPRHGSTILALSSGHARSATQANACGSLTCSIGGTGTAPAGFPQDVPGCSGASDINDDIALEVTVQAPTNATGYSFDFSFYSFEYPEWVCTSFNDQFIALVNPPPMGSINGNISFDSQSNPVSVNIAFFEVCAEAGCSLGTSELQGTGFDTWDDAGATSWLVTAAPIEPGGTATIRWAIWDTGDTAWDSTVLLDNFQWIANGGSVAVGTIPAPN